MDPLAPPTSSSPAATATATTPRALHGSERTSDPSGGAVRERTLGRAALEILAFSLAVTALAALTATAWNLFAPEMRWSLAFVYLRWLFVAVLLVTPLLHQALVRLVDAPGLPFALRTPATALVLTVESIGFDVLSARLD